MARIEISGFEDVERQLLQRTERAAKAVPRMVQAGAQVVVDSQCDEIQGMFGGSRRSTGALKKSITIAPIKTNSTGTFTTVYPRGKDSKTGVENATKGFVLEHGRKGDFFERFNSFTKKGQALSLLLSKRKRGYRTTIKSDAHNWYSESMKKADGKVQAAMRKTWEDTQDG